MTEDSATSNEEQKLLEGIVNFGNFDVKQVMRPRIDVFALNQEEPFEDVLEKVVKKGIREFLYTMIKLILFLGYCISKIYSPHIHLKKFDWVSLLRETVFCS